MPLDTLQLLTYLPVALALNLTPGNDMLFCLGQGMKSGPRAGIAASLGIATGSLIYTILAAMGLAALLAAHPTAFHVIRWVGIAYLVWLAVQTLRRPVAVLSTDDQPYNRVVQAYRQGVIVNLLNPKIALFFLAFIPQFVNPQNGSSLVQFLLLGMIVNCTGTTVNALVGGFAGTIGGKLATNPLLASLFRTLSALVFLGLAAKLVLTRQ